ncbi:hypothetical protein LU298_03715 [Komagataeibacter intermedius]|uniref:Uncharacterized protein n=2 Tax=Komagataeibacter intermedius TaxID=66229 RepID=A0A0N1FCU6_9PROT|nr:hypothetical protein [Komagataeibacter intermedius]KPH88267.1 hypothetical protein GLUCOINTEAF2_0201682 [Komagataeibacter intermedius AF2]MCF3635607.1 hypothetical protein [Komagataeibacter intermedius]GAN87673.1 hypothetical protein Gain_0077_013 [Komagataeibacter intermedius TF2]GBQ75425.1 hypothetical protein AA0521_2659 [Komagataeibacter intermedius NRIC 0521]
MRLVSLAAVAAAVSLSGLAPFTCAHAADALGQNTATITFTLSAADLGAGMSWGKGVLTFEGHDYPFRIRGGSGAAIGFSRTHATGTVYNLYRVADIEGTYWSVQGEATVGAGKGAAVMENNNGIHIKFSSRSTGARLAFSVERLTISLTPEEKAGLATASATPASHE